MRPGGFLCYYPDMAEFHDVLKSIREWSGEESPSPDLYDELSGEYQKLVDQRDGATVLIAERDTRIQEMDAEVKRLKGENYDLSVAAGAKEPEDPPETETRPHGIMGLFERRNK